MISFQRLKPSQRSLCQPFLQTAAHRGCGYSFGNLVLWGQQHMAVEGSYLVLFSHFQGRSMYPFPAGSGDLKGQVEAIVRDARERGIPCRFIGMTASEVEALEALFPGEFCFHCDRDAFDYVYDIHDLAELKGRRFQQKRNHVNRFTSEHPDAYVRPISRDNLADCQRVVSEWFESREQAEPYGDFRLEKVALERSFRFLEELELEGLVLYADGRPIAMTMGSRLNADTMDIHFEKADASVTGAYAAVNRAFARYLRDKYPELKYLNREDDMGEPGLRKAKLSYQPHHLVEKYWAHRKEDEAFDGI